MRASLLVLLTSTAGMANGAFPSTRQIATPVDLRSLAVSPVDPATLWLPASYPPGRGDEVASACVADWDFQKAIFTSARPKVAARAFGCRSAGSGGWLVAASFFAAPLRRRIRRAGRPA